MLCGLFEVWSALRVYGGPALSLFLITLIITLVKCSWLKPSKLLEDKVDKRRLGLQWYNSFYTDTHFNENLPKKDIEKLKLNYACHLKNNNYSYTDCKRIFIPLCRYKNSINTGMVFEIYKTFQHLNNFKNKNKHTNQNTEALKHLCWMTFKLSVQLCIQHSYKHSI